MTTQLSLSLPPVLPSRIQAAVEATLIGAGYPYTTSSDEYGWCTRVDIDGTRGSLHLGYDTYEERSSLDLSLDPGILVTDATRTETALLLAWFNTYQHFTNWFLHPARDQVMIRVALAEELGVTIDAASVEQMTRLAYTADKHYSARIREVAEGRATARDIFPLIVPTAYR